MDGVRLVGCEGPQFSLSYPRGDFVPPLRVLQRVGQHSVGRNHVKGRRDDHLEPEPRPMGGCRTSGRSEVSGAKGVEKMALIVGEGNRGTEVLGTAP